MDVAHLIDRHPWDQLRCQDALARELGHGRGHAEGTLEGRVRVHEGFEALLRPIIYLIGTNKKKKR